MNIGRFFRRSITKKAKKDEKTVFASGTDIIRVDRGMLEVVYKKRVPYQFFSGSAATDKLHNSVPLRNKS